MRRGPYGGHMQRREFITLLGGTVAAGRTRATAGDAGGWVYQRGFCQKLHAAIGRHDVLHCK